MRPELVVEVEVAHEPLLHVTNDLMRMEIHLFILETPPQLFHEDIAVPSVTRGFGRSSRYAQQAYIFEAHLLSHRAPASAS